MSRVVGSNCWPLYTSCDKTSISIRHIVGPNSYIIAVCSFPSLKFCRSPKSLGLKSQIVSKELVETDSLPLRIRIVPAKLIVPKGLVYCRRDDRFSILPPMGADILTHFVPVWITRQKSWIGI